MWYYLKFKIPFTIVLEDSIPPLAIENIGLIHAISNVFLLWYELVFFHHGSSYMGIHSLLNFVGLPQALQLQIMLRHQDAIAFVHLASHSPLTLHTNTLEKMQTFSPNIHTPNHIIY
jgi:hypothetical protein